MKFNIRLLDIPEPYRSHISGSTIHEIDTALANCNASRTYEMYRGYLRLISFEFEREEHYQWFLLMWI